MTSFSLSLYVSYSCLFIFSFTVLSFIRYQIDYCQSHFIFIIISCLYLSFCLLVSLSSFFVPCLFLFLFFCLLSCLSFSLFIAVFFLFLKDLLQLYLFSLSFCTCCSISPQVMTTIASFFCLCVCFDPHLVFTFSHHYVCRLRPIFCLSVLPTFVCLLETAPLSSSYSFFQLLFQLLFDSSPNRIMFIHFML